MDQPAIVMIAGNRLPKLLECPRSSGMRGRVHVEEFSASHFHHHEDVKDAESGSNRDHEIAGNDCLGVISDKRHPALGCTSVGLQVHGPIGPYCSMTCPP